MMHGTVCLNEKRSMAYTNSPKLGSLPSSCRWAYMGFICMSVITFCSIVVLDASVITMFSSHMLSFAKQQKQKQKQNENGFFNLTTALAWTSMVFICVLIPVFLVLVFLVGWLHRRKEAIEANPVQVQENQSVQP